jgi:hypothetical protein
VEFEESLKLNNSCGTKHLTFSYTCALASAKEAVNIFSTCGNILCRTGVKTIGKKFQIFLSHKIANITQNLFLQSSGITKNSACTKIDNIKDLFKFPETILKTCFM